MQFTLGMLCGVIIGAVVAVAYGASAQLALFDAPLDQQLNGQRAEQYLKLERELERRTADSSKPPCPY